MAPSQSEFTPTNLKEAQEALAKWKIELPVVESVYQPSGIMPAVALASMCAGALAGSFGAMLAGGALFGAAWAATFGLYGYWAGQGAPVGLIELVGSLVLGAVLFGAAAIVPGLIVAKAAAAGSRRAKNRNPRWASVVAGTVGAMVALVLYSTWHQRAVLDSLSVLDRFDPFGLKEPLVFFGPLGWAIAAFGIVAAAAGFTLDHVRAQKFCEGCSEFLTGGELSQISWAGGRKLKGDSAQLSAAAVRESVGGHAGQDVKVEMFCCPKCGAGILECIAPFKAQWTGDKPGILQEQWLFLSAKFSA
jgi:hypothetical protein